LVSIEESEEESYAEAKAKRKYMKKVQSANDVTGN
jgi:hypothetical protein